VRGSEREARRQLKGLLEDATNARVHSGSVGDLLDRWFTAASSDWAASTNRETTSTRTLFPAATKQQPSD